MAGDGTIVAGPPVVDAFDCQEIQNSVGILVSPHVREHTPDLEGMFFVDNNAGRGHPYGYEAELEKKLPLALSAHPAAIPFHRHGVPFNGLAIVPVCPGDHVDTWHEQTYDVAVSQLRRLRLEAPDPGA